MTAIILTPRSALSKTLTIAVIDTGVDATAITHLCKYGHRSYIGNHPTHDPHGHGTHIASLIEKYAGVGDYCIVSLQYYSEVNSGQQNLRNLKDAMQFAINIKVDFINVSGGGPEYNEEEQRLIKNALDKGIKVVVAAGNEHHNLSTYCDYYPACYKDSRMVVVGNRVSEETWQSGVYYMLRKLITRANRSDDESLKRASDSNWGDVITRWEIGDKVEGRVPCHLRHLNPDPKERCAAKMSGTSQATAIATGKLVHERLTK